MNDILTDLNIVEHKAAAIRAAIAEHGARAVYDAANAAFAGDKTALRKLTGLEITNLGIVHAAQAAAFDRLGPADRRADLAAARRELARMGGRATSPRKAASSRANGRLGGRPSSTRRSAK